MKRLFVPTIALLLSTATVAAQEQTLIQGDVVHGGFGGLIVKGTTLMGDPAVMVGGGGAWVINHTVLLGIEGSGLASIVDADRLAWDGRPYRLQIAEGGVRLGYVHASDAIVHLTGSLLVGAGTVFYFDRTDWPELEPTSEFDPDAYFLLEPEVMGELNVTRWMRIAAGAGYRWVTGVDYDNLKGKDLSGPTVQVAFKFGKF